MTIASAVDIQSRHLLITQRLRQRRDDLGLTQKQVVTRLGRCGLRTTNRALSSLEHGTGLDVAKLPELAAALDCTVTYLVGLTDDPHRWEPDDEVVVPPRSSSVRTPLQAADATTGRTGGTTGRTGGTTGRPDGTTGRTDGVRQPVNGTAAGAEAASLILGDAIPDRTLRGR
ncbi:MAG: helix-turn-helix domain-containing protein [Actinomycetota bacterium]|nr:helix-turn-helix domain-containing protein [Actinomycetota bacterium]